MNLWLTVTWLTCGAICVGIFSFWRKRMADIAEHVAEETDNRIRKILKAERDAETRLFEAFTNFGNPAEAIRTYQKTLSEAFSCPQAVPDWNWNREDIELWRRETQNQQRTNRGRPTALAAIFAILAFSVGATVMTAITLNSVKPMAAVAMQNSPGGTVGGATGQMPAQTSLPVQTIPVASPPVLPTAYTPTPTSNGIDARTSSGTDSLWDSGDIYHRDADLSDRTGVCWPNADPNQDANCVPDCNVTESFGSPTEREDHGE